MVDEPKITCPPVVQKFGLNLENGNTPMMQLLESDGIRISFKAMSKFIKLPTSSPPKTVEKLTLDSGSTSEHGLLKTH